MTCGDVAALSCPSCRGPLGFEGTLAGEHLDRGTLRCGRCAGEWPVEDGIPDLVDEAEVRGLDRLMRFFYDLGAPLHDPAVRYLLPLLQGSSEEALREAYMPRLELGGLVCRDGGLPARILEVGVGGGGNLPWLERELPADVSAEFWGLDLSRNMLEQCRSRLARHRGRPMRLLLANAHALPFADGSVDRVFSVGGIAGFHDPRRALAEMARVARPGTPIVVVDEQLDPDRAHSLYHRLMFRALTLYDPAPRCPRAHLPPDAVDVAEEQASRFYYCLTFRMPSGRGMP